MEGTKRFGVKDKLAPRYIGPFPIVEKCGPVTYKLDLPSSLAGVHNVFQVSKLKKCLMAPSDVVLPDVTPLKPDLSYPEHSIKLLDQNDRAMRRKTLRFYKVEWSNHSEEEAMWEIEEFVHSHHPDFLPPPRKWASSVD
jgi:hypothetical protein